MKKSFYDEINMVELSNSILDLKKKLSGGREFYNSNILFLLGLISKFFEFSKSEIRFQFYYIFQKIHKIFLGFFK